MSNIMRYKGYVGTVEYLAEDKLFFGEIAFINDTVLFEGETVKELENNFKESVNHYIETCKKAGKEPQKAFKGLFLHGSIRKFIRRRHWLPYNARCRSISWLS